jgi:hypothetical protein
MDEANPMIVPKLVVVTKRIGECCRITLASPTPSTIAVAQKEKAKIDEARKPYAIRMKEARAIARARREAEKAAWHRRLELIVECRRMALDLTKAEIRDRGDKISKYTLAQIAAVDKRCPAVVARLGSVILPSFRHTSYFKVPITHDRDFFLVKAS